MVAKIEHSDALCSHRRVAVIAALGVVQPAGLLVRVEVLEVAEGTKRAAVELAPPAFTTV